MSFHNCLKLICFCVVVVPGVASAQTEVKEESVTANQGPVDPAPVEQPVPKKPDVEGKTSSRPVGVTIDAGLATAYNFRGLNVFGDYQSDQHLVFSPSLSYAILDTGLSLSYWGAYQVNGDNKSAKVDAGSGHEQDFVVAWSKSWFDNKLTFKATFTTYIYPFADEATAGTTCPVYLEPSVTLTYSNVLDLNLQLAYFAGVQDAIKDFRYLYIRPYVSKSFKLSPRVTQLVGVGYGFKLFNDFGRIKDNVHDIAFDFETTIAITSYFYVKPAFRGGWTNLTGKSIGEEYVLLGSLNLGFVF